MDAKGMRHAKHWQVRSERLYDDHKYGRTASPANAPRQGLVTAWEFCTLPISSTLPASPKSSPCHVWISLNCIWIFDPLGMPACRKTLLLFLAPPALHEAPNMQCLKQFVFPNETVERFWAHYRFTVKAVGILTTCLVNQAQGEKSAWQSQDFAHLFPVDQLSRRFVRLLRRSEECFQPVKLTFPFRIATTRMSTLQELSPHPVSMARAALHPPSARSTDKRALCSRNARLFAANMYNNVNICELCKLFWHRNCNAIPCPHQSTASASAKKGARSIFYDVLILSAF